MNTETHYWKSREGHYFARVQCAEGTRVFGPADSLAELHLLETEGVSMVEHLETMLERTMP